MLRSVPIGMSRLGCGTVTRPGFVGCLNCAWLPFRATSVQPFANKRLITSALWMCIYTHWPQRRQTPVKATGRGLRLSTAIPQEPSGTRQGKSRLAFDRRSIARYGLPIVSLGLAASMHFGLVALEPWPLPVTIALLAIVIVLIFATVFVVLHHAET